MEDFEEMIMMTPKKPILISGIQPTGKFHSENYLGALKNFVELQNSELFNGLNLEKSLTTKKEMVKRKSVG
ncbi:hypothetical protein COY65_01150 [Candidatus Jorgensenbacteria bacterium CG_4_10_14_0_8_um_filter_39_13]|uniref:Tryptophan--tRNA ligase n=2 Tax=Candidatus Joergenseniibacteriota TaxID=1752739 RepID=A0A2M7RHL0_9BACT|nr:MAG: hypothetical protein COV54_01195 [Candidatus Jorgensenbacteria bacterium CG11_big_fil_rev_8_21_14_0_20_38_23]PIV13222.1 MAG: hypothetical protein COS46_01310 [Candidatus Jorgensenbacteria bacterium CG03_land_8_20_14_0_80_38_39]PIY96229.1 MAG: hypothetical protein COY65_01150 [Candidatus Jorgensenbacteria bacterium CG_4_10_14_0_8_um_filter_39_13]PJA95013.1 MAG: hypothetical protein CO130_01375 [Candidatus Jorgensenbacteria bacterium CG_4_9_14_3_um_filter_38_10]